MEKSNLTDKNHTSVYNVTTKPKKPKRRDKSDLGPDFVAPDGGWGWVVCLAAGLNNFFLFPALQQYGLIYRVRMLSLGFDAKETTTIVNCVMAISSLVGIVNGAMFRRFTFRQVALTGTTLAFVGIFMTAFCTTVWQYIFCLSAVYGIGLGLAMAATSLAVNTYFKQRRRRATGFSWTITGLGPIFFPHVSTWLLGFYGAQGTILIYAGIAMNAVLCALTLQPVLRHARKPKTESADGAETAKDQPEMMEANGNLLAPSSDPWIDYECKYCQYQKRAKRGIFSSQYLFNVDDPERPGYEITEPGTPMLARANDGWFGSKLSLTADQGAGGARYRTRKELMRQVSSRSRENLDRLETSRTDEAHEQALYKPNYFNREREDLERYASKTSVYSKHGQEELLRCTCAEDKALLQKTAEAMRLEQMDDQALQAEEDEAKSRMTLFQKVSKFFDLDLLRDFTFVNLAVGMSIMMFGEMNFSVLTPFILNNFGYSDEKISIVMSLLACMDISVRFLAPFALEKVKLDNRVLFAFGILCIAVGRVVVAFTDSYEVMIGVFLLIGFGKGFRTIFSPLIIPSYVPLNRLPAASGLQLIFNTIFSFAMGPILGSITEAFGYAATIHAINFLTALALLLWLSESIVRRVLKRPSKGLGH
ncbi:monocarboxylate transporter 1-like isoform X1 [Drosophila subobscura]|uniref:monocarboxylate transporter 1-like isoform X1 n=1 Tax=Drosophila subobscura TaxID=7241 RepID=UPI00155AE991|nr:monocarboxylate transporter 1-like isoform X1 [Drosophila subobscura]